MADNFFDSVPTDGDTAVAEPSSQPNFFSQIPTDAPQPRFTITPPDSVTAPIPRGISRDDLKNLQLKTRVESVPAALADKALSVAEPIAKNFSSDLLNTPNNAIGLVAPDSALAKPAFQPQTPVINVPQPKGTGFAAGLGRLGAGLLSGLTTPESIVTLPAASQSAIVRALFGGQMASDLPESARNAINVLQDPNATTADKVVAVGNPIVQSAMIAGLAAVKGAAKPSGIKEIEQPETPNEEIAPPNTAPLDTPATAAEAPPAAEPSVSPAAPAESVNPTFDELAAKYGVNANGTLNLEKPVLRPALRDGDNILTGGGNKHDELILAHMNEMPPEAQGDFLVKNAEDKVERGFVDQDGNFLTRDEAAKTGVFGDKAPMSENLPNYNPENTPAPINSFKEKSSNPASDFERYKELTSSLKGRTMDEAQPVLKEIEAIKNRNGGNPPIAPKISEPEANVSNAEQTAASQPMAQNPTGLKFDILDKERAARGLEPLPRRVPVSDQQTMAKAQERLGKNEDYADNLVKELNLKPRSIDDVDRAALLIRKIDLEKQYSDAADDLIKANESGDQDAAASANVRVSDISDKQQALEEASGKSGSEQGAGLRFLRVMANEDYSLSGLERKLRASKGGAPLTDAERAELVKTANDYKAKNEALENHVKELQEKNSAHEVKAALDKIALEAKTKTGTSNNPKPRAGGILSALESRANAARERIKNRPVQLNAGLDPTQLIASLRDEIEIGAYHVARIGADVAKWTKEKLEDWQNSLKKELGDKITPNLPIILEQAKKTVDDALKPPNHEEQVAAQSAKIKEKFDSGKKDEIASQVQKLARLFIERGITGRDALIDAIHNVIKESDPEITRRETMDAISGYGDFKQLSKDEISVKLRGLKGEMQQVSKLEDMAKGVPPSKTGVERRSPTDAERKLIKAVNDAKIKFQVPITDPVRQIKSALDTRKIQIENSIKDLQDKIKNEDYSKRVRRPLVPDRKLQELQAQKERVVKEFKGKQLKYEREQLSKAPRAADFISNLRRFSVLSGVHVLGKLAAYSATKIPTIAATELAGKVISKIPKLSEISNKAPSEGGGSLSKLARATAKGLTQGIIDAYKTGRYGQSDLKAAYSKRPETERNWLSFFQTLHEVIKSPLRRASFELSLAKRMESADRNKVDTSDPLVQLALSKDAYLDSDRDLLLENNRVANGIRMMLRNLEAKDKNTGRIPIAGKTIATAGRVALPILTVPLNYAKQTLDYGFGLAIGSGKAALAFKRGIKNLDPQEADEIIRHLKRGSVGGAAILYGFYDGYKNANNQNNATFGGFYQPGEKRKDNQAGINGIRVGGVNLPGLVLHNPVIAAAQLGATFGKILASKINKKSGETHSVPVAAAASLAGLLNQSPIGSNSEFLQQLSDPRTAEYALGEYAKGLAVPQLVQEAAQFTDKDANGKPIKRAPVTALQHIKTGIPILRETVKKK